MAKKEENPLENALNIEPTEVRDTTHNVKDPAKVSSELRKTVEIDLSKFPERKRLSSVKTLVRSAKTLKR